MNIGPRFPDDDRFSVLPARDRLGVRDVALFLDGRWVAPLAQAPFDQVHPSTQEVVARIAQADEADVARAVTAARKAFDEGPWPRMKARERKVHIDRIVALVRRHSDELSQLQTLDNGMPIAWSMRYRVSGHFAADLFDHFGGWIDKINGEFHPQVSEEVALQFISMRDPVGVVAAIIPWNAPLMQFSNKVAPALACGNTVVLKPSEYASLVARRMAELIAEADLPPGVFNFVTGGPATGDALVRHPGVDKITFTGSRAVGEHIMRTAAADIKRVTLELGGKSAALVFPDAPNVDTAAANAMAMVSTFMSGQVCSTPSRALVHRDIVDRFLDAATRQLDQVRFGDPFDSATTSAPMINARQLDKVRGYIEQGVRQGARLVAGGSPPPRLRGNFVAPALFADVRNDMTIAREEIFGPVLTVTPFDTEEQAIAIANDSPYGLSGAVHTANIARAFRVTRGLRTGTVGVNGYSYMPNSPFGGFKQSGIGREGGWAAVEAYTELKTMIVNLDA
jgi:aldehyde dehydrogenase (NAD+)